LNVTVNTPEAGLGKPGAALLTLTSLLGGVALLVYAAQSGGSLENPVGYRVWEYGMIATALAILGVGIVGSIRERRLSRTFLIAVSCATAFWQETYGDWGTYLLYSDKFHTYGWGQGPYTSPVQCWWFIAGYVVFYSTLMMSMRTVVAGIKQRWPNVNPYLGATLACFPVFYIFDFLMEATVTGLGLWRYTYIFGPGLSVGSGTFPLLWPIVEQVPFIALAAWAMTWTNSEGHDVFDLAATKVLRRPPGQLAILMSWIALVNLVFLVTTILPLMLLRVVAGGPSVLVP